jgi:hypothetical protein
MKPIAVLGADSTIERETPVSPDCRRAVCSEAPRVIADRPLGRAEFDRASEAFDQHDAKYPEGCSTPILSKNLKPNIYYKAQDFTLGASRAPRRSDASRAETSAAREMAARRGFLFDAGVIGEVEGASCDR